MTQQGGPRIRFGLTSIGTATASVTSKELPHLTASLFPSSRRHEQITFTSRSASWGGFSIHRALCSLAPAPQKKTRYRFPGPTSPHPPLQSQPLGRGQAVGPGVGDTASTLPPGSLGAPKSQASVKRQQTQAVKRGSRGSPPAPEAPRPGRAGQGRAGGSPRLPGAAPTAAEQKRSGSGAGRGAGREQQQRRPGRSWGGGRGGKGPGTASTCGHLPPPRPGTDRGERGFSLPPALFLLPPPLPPAPVCKTNPPQGSEQRETPAPERGGLRRILKLSNQHSLVVCFAKRRMQIRSLSPSLNQADSECS